MIKKEVKGMKADEEGVNSGRLWRILKILNPKYNDPPTAVLDGKGNFITTTEGIKKVSMEHFSKVLSDLPIEEDLEDLRKEKEKLCEERMKICKDNKTSPWTMEYLEIVLRKLKLNKSRDLYGLTNDLFRLDRIGNDLKLAILKLMNRIKQEQIYPSLLETCDISAFWKNKGKWGRGGFRLTVLRTILDRLIYNDEYSTVDENLTDCNVGARRKRGMNDNLFVLGALMNSAAHEKDGPLFIQLCIIEKAFNSSWLPDCINDLFEAGIQNDKIPLLYMSNKRANVSFKLNQNKSKRFIIEDSVC